MVEAKTRIEQIHEMVMSGLKDFQRKTVERVDRLFENGQNRVLVSDEVGLGKTFIARGVIAKLALRKAAEGKTPIKVVYICSNGAIAGQNLDKMMIGTDTEVRKEAVGTSRLSMQHLNIFTQEHAVKREKRFLQLIPLTPDTSFRMTSGAGTAEERALMYVFLRRIPQLQPWQRQLDVAMRDCAYKAWSWYRTDAEGKVSRCDEDTGGAYSRYMMERVTQALCCPGENGESYLDQLTGLCRRIQSCGNQRVRDNRVISKLRRVFAEISLERLEPDLVIMDEFQRFRYMIDSEADTDVGILRSKFFGSKVTKMLLLSATPYKMYSTLEEIEEDEEGGHFREFWKVMEFLQNDEQQMAHFQRIWKNYSMELQELSRGRTTILTAKQTAEDALYRHICRTERASARESADLMDTRDLKRMLRIQPSDVRAYVQARKLIEEIHMSGRLPVDYVKSCPYLLSFMQNYKLKRDIERYFKAHPDEVHLLKRKELWVSRRSFDRYEEIDPGNARLARVMDHVFRQNAQKLLWVPPSRPYYPLTGVFAGTEHFSKILVFSSWEMVPRMLAGMLSYEAERRTTGVLARANPEKEARYFHTENKRFPAARLQFSLNKDQPRAMTLFCLMYPSRVLAGCYDPVECMNQGMDLCQIERSVREKLKSKLERFENTVRTGNEDYKWYYLVPMLLDPPGYVDAWLDSEHPLSAYDEEDKNQKQKGFQRHLQELRLLYKQFRSGKGEALGRMPEDLLDVLTAMAIASPAVCAWRTYRRYATDGKVPEYLPSQIARVFLNRMNSPESTAVVELCYGQSEDAHWRNLLNYCKDGNLQAVFDEYAYLLTVGPERNEKTLIRLHSAMISAMNFRTNVYNVDTYEYFRKRACGEKGSEVNIRNHFAVAFTKGVGDQDADRKKSVRNAFNSPFRPFVLASTSIGQEGLDFHYYCRRIVHWNLPSNPIDLEQREGRINRFACLAIRQNIADRYGGIPFRQDIWEEMFRYAKKEEQTEGCSELIPYWGVTEREDMVRIERIVPMYPFSRDQLAYDRLMQILSLYRLTLGQARQEELVDYLLQRDLDGSRIQDLCINLSPFYKEP